MSEGPMRLTAAASVLKTCQLVSLLVNFVLWLLCLPAQLLIHHRVGKRRMNTVFFGLSLFLLSTVAVLLLSATSSLPTVQLTGGLQAINLHDPKLNPAATFAIFYVVTIIAFLCQYFDNRRRFGTPDQGHSLDAGVSWIAYAIGHIPRLINRKPSGPLELSDSAIIPPLPAGVASGTLRELAAYPLAIIGRFTEHLRQHAARVQHGETPHGPLNWFLVAIAEPAILLALGIAMTFVEGLRPFGFYTCLVAIALFWQGQFAAAELRERLYSDHDAELEMNAMRNLRDGSPLDQVSRVYTLPISKAIIPPKRKPASISGPGLDSQMTMGDLYSESTEPSEKAAA